MPATGAWRILAAGARGRYLARAYSPALARPIDPALRYSAGPRVARTQDFPELHPRMSLPTIAELRVLGRPEPGNAAKLAL